MSMSAEELVLRLWDDHVAITPQAPEIWAWLRARGERFGSDHLALRSLGPGMAGVEALASSFTGRGWQPTGEYAFPHKGLVARSFGHADPALPRVFISALEPDFLGVAARRLVERLVPSAAGLEGDAALLPLDAERSAPVTLAEYVALRAESEYAAWVAAFGVRVNHFTVAVNDLRTVPDLEGLVAALQAAGHVLNGESSGAGVIQGSPAEGLEQCSTVARRVPWTFADGQIAAIPGGYCEFARRHQRPGDTGLFDAFIAGSADKIFESTHSDRARD